VAPLVAQFASQRKLSKTDIAALKALLKEHGHD
jgi:BlaI family penicillinase repressor